MTSSTQQTHEVNPNLYFDDDLVEVDRTGPIRKALDVVLEPGSVAELRVPKTERTKTVSGYFDDFDKLAEAAAEWSDQAPGVYVTLNPVLPDLLARTSNRAKGWAENTTTDSQIVRRRWLPLDFDAVRPSGISSTDAQHEAALERARECQDWLVGLGFSPDSLVLADSGNGAHLLVRLDLPNDDESTALVNRCLKAADLYLSDDTVKVDCGVGNAARIWKVYGTLAAKGDNVPDRPHRLAALLEFPKRQKVAPHELLERLAARAPRDV
ncbi:MAG TPA: hypothetical protein VJP78_07080 [Thermoleophilia bacterium]|nr:hypothetical protein [Thermoleophilia bacterium]